MPLSRLSVCLKCGAELYVCKLCRFHDPKLRRGCLEDRAEHVQEKERANFCEFFEPKPHAHEAKDGGGADKARADLGALFGGPKQEVPEDPVRAELDKLFSNKSKT